MKTNMRSYGDKVYTNCSLNVPEDGVECKSYTIISSDSLLVYENYCLLVYLDICNYKIVDKQMIDYLDNLFETDEDYFLISINGSYKYYRN